MLANAPVTVGSVSAGILLLAADSAAEPVFKATREPGYGAFAVLVQLVGIGVLGA
jgi:hypothetical protein